MMIEPLISVIVPVYNVKDYLPKCIFSILKQTYSRFEVIIVDDGSTDGSSDICDDIKKMDARLKVVHQNNMGVACARKNGIQISSGEYICFVDSDDKIDSEMIGNFVKGIGKCDIITSGCYCENSNGEYSIRTDAFDEGIYDTNEAMEYFIANMVVFQDSFDDGILPFLVNKMFRSDIVKTAVSDVDTSISYGEDRDLLYRCVLKSNAIKVTHKSYYHYQQRADSAMNSPNDTYMSDVNGLYLSLKKVFEKHAQKDSLMHQLQLMISLRTYVMTWYMGFPSDTQSPAHVFPFTDIKKDSKIVLYGAGKVGKDYYRQIKRHGCLKIVLWVDKEWEKQSIFQAQVKPPHNIEECDFDYIIIAVKSKENAEAIRKKLNESGISDKKILWEKPIMLAL